MDDRVIRGRVATARLGRLATVTAQGRPHVVPCCFVLAGDTIYSAVDDVKPKSTSQLRRIDNIRAVPFASLLVDHDAQDWSQLWWIRADGPARVVADPPERSRALALLMAKYDRYDSRPPPGDVLAIDVETWRAWP